MARMIEQTRNAIDDLKACGLARGEFRVQTPCKHGYYDRAQVSLRCSRERQFEVLDALASRFTVQIVHRSGVFRFAAVTPEYRRPFKGYIDLDVNLDGVDVTTDEGYAAHMAFRATPERLRLA